MRRHLRALLLVTLTCIPAGCPVSGVVRVNGEEVDLAADERRERRLRGVRRRLVEVASLAADRVAEPSAKVQALARVTALYHRASDRAAALRTFLTAADVAQQVAPASKRSRAAGGLLRELGELGDCASRRDKLGAAAAALLSAGQTEFAVGCAVAGEHEFALEVAASLPRWRERLPLVRAMLDAARAAGQRAKLEAVADSVERLLAGDSQTSERVEVAALLVRARTFLGQTRAAMRLAGSELERIEVLTNPTRRADALGHLVGALVELARRHPEGGRSLLTAAAAHAGAASHPTHVSRALRVLAEAWYELGDLQTARSMVLSAAINAAKIEDAYRRAEQLGMVAVLYLRLGDQREAERLAKDSLKAARELAVGARRDACLARVAWVRGRLGRFDPAVELLALAGPRGKAILRREIAHRLAHAGQSERAIEVAAAIDVGFSEIKAAAFGLIAAADRSSLDGGALRAAATRIEHRPARALAFIAIANAHLRRKQRPRALELLDLAAALAAEQPLVERKVQVVRPLAAALIGADRFERALELSGTLPSSPAVQVELLAQAGELLRMASDDGLAKLPRSLDELAAKLGGSQL